MEINLELAKPKWNTILDYMDIKDEDNRKFLITMCENYNYNNTKNNNTITTGINGMHALDSTIKYIPDTILPHLLSVLSKNDIYKTKYSFSEQITNTELIYSLTIKEINEIEQKTQDFTITYNEIIKLIRDRLKDRFSEILSKNVESIEYQNTIFKIVNNYHNQCYDLFLFIKIN